ncbi:unnamed protein product [Larinioides sclopetarius]|uniref:FLYWCH-type domain-containing protein n=1 Tax=Larinioides sclopetarius TaxID=280406 RepID=A0AAV2A6G7_9ARAC
MSVFEDERVRFIRNQKGTEMLIYEGFPFIRHFTTDKKTYWRCADFQKYRCTARCHTYESNFLRKISEHNHSSRNFSSYESEPDRSLPYVYTVPSYSVSTETILPTIQALPYK